MSDNFFAEFSPKASSNFFSEFAPSWHGLPPGFEYVDDKDNPPPQHQTTARGLIGAGESGLNAGIAGMLGGGVARNLERGVGIDSALRPDATTAEKIAHAAGYGAGAATTAATGVGLLGKLGMLGGPGLETVEAITGAPTAATAGLGAAAGAAGGTAAEVAPEKYRVAAQLAAQLATGHTVGKIAAVGAEAAPAESNVEKFLGEADVAEARAAGAKTRGEIDEFIRNKETANAPRIEQPQVQNAPRGPVNEPQGIGHGEAGDAPGLPSIPSKQGPVLTASRGQDGAQGAEPPPTTDYHPPEGFEEIPRGIAPNSAAPAQLPETPTKSTPEIPRGIVPGYSEYAAPGGVWREDEFGMPQLVEATGLRPVDIDPQALEAARTHVANGEEPALAYERAVVEAALADPKVRSINDGETLPTKLPDQAGRATSIAPPTQGPQNAPTATPEPRQPVAGAGATQVPAMGESPASGAQEAKSDDSQRAFIAKDIARQVTEAGRPPDEAEAAGQLWAARFAARAASLGGARGTAEDLYRAEGPDIQGQESPSGNRSTPARVKGAEYRETNDAAIRQIEQAFKEAGLPSPGPENNAAVSAAARLLTEGKTNDPWEAWETAERENAAYGEHLRSIGLGPGAEVHFQRGSSARNLRPEPLAIGPNAEAGAEGLPQTLIPGVKPVTDKDRAELAATKPLRGGNAPAEEGGLFDTEGPKQQELFQRDLAPTFHSAVARAIDNARQEKALPGQWLATLKNTPGVKPEEMKWLGVEDWLKDQKGTVTRQQIADYVRANQIEVREVEKSQDAGRPLVAKRMPEGYWEIRGDDGQFITNITTPHLTEDEAITEARNRLGRNQSTELGSLPKFRQYTLPGGGNYRELLLTLPVKSPPEIAATMEAQKALDEFVSRIRNGPNDVSWMDRLSGDQREELNSLRDVRNKARDLSGGKESAGYKSPHWEEPNVISHIRFDDRTVNGERALHLAEVQSDWHQEGRRKGYVDQGQLSQIDKKIDELNQLYRNDTKIALQITDTEEKLKQSELATARLREIGVQTNELHRQRLRIERAVPDAPFKTTWPELAMKRMIRYAAEHGYDRLTWDTGDTNAERYDLSKQISKITWTRKSEHAPYGYLTAYNHSGNIVIESVRTTPEQLADHVGKDVAEKLVNQEPKKTKLIPVISYGGAELTMEETEHGRKFVAPDGRSTYIGKGAFPDAQEARESAERVFNGQAHDINSRRVEQGVESRELSGLDLKVGGEGMRGFYDRILPAAVNKLTKRFGGKVEDAKINPGEAERAIRAGLNDPGVIDAMNAAAKPVHSLKLTPALEDAALGEGFPLFQGARGKIRLAEGNRPIITLMGNANASTLFHEGGHEFLDEMMRDAAHPAATPELRDDAQTTRDWLGVNADEELKARHHERFARGFEQYLREGKAPSAGLARVFEKFKAWLTEIYKTIKGLGKPISNDIRRVFDRLLVPGSDQISGRRRAS
jgi:hypothetical protein